MAEIPVQPSQEQDIYSFGFDLNLNKQVVLGADQSGYGQSTSNVEVGGVYIGSILQDCLIANSVLFDNKLDNVLIGRSALNLKTTGSNNVAIGFEVLKSNTTGFRNIGIGPSALFSNTTGSQNISMGYISLKQNTSGGDNIGIGNDSLNQNTNGGSNIAIGSSAANGNTEGDRNIAIGTGALDGNTTGSDNIAIGSFASVGDVNLINAIAIGSNTVVNTSNTMVLGGTGANAVSVAIGRTTASATLDVNGDILANNLSGWIAATETWTYASADSPTFTFTISGDKTTKYSVGMKIKLTQTTDKYFIITAVSYSSPNTTVTIYGGTDYTLANAAITSPTFSSLRAPFGFPLNPTKWTVETKDTTDRSQATPTSGTWYNLGSITISIPIGMWRVYYTVAAAGDSLTATVSNSWVTLSTANNSESDVDFTTKRYMEIGAASNPMNLLVTLHVEKYLSLASKTSYYLNSKTNRNTLNGISFYNAFAHPCIIRAVCAYL